MSTLRTRARTRIAVRVIAGLLVAIALGTLGCAWLVVHGTLVDRTRFVHPDDGILVLDRHGAPLRHVRTNGADRRWVPLGEISPQLVSAVIATEDADYFAHAGISLRAIARALVRNAVPGGAWSGASTITQQLVKLVYPRSAQRGPVVVWCKAVETLRALALERTFTKGEILEQYLNRVPFGDRIEGVARASEEYFGVPVRDLDVAQSALLAGIPQAPSVTEPRRHLARALARRDHVLARMLATGAIDASTYARVRDVRPAIRGCQARPYEAARFVDTVLAGVRDRTAGSVTTSLDVQLQRDSVDVLGETVARFEARGVRNGAGVVVANATGEVLAYVAAARSGAHATGGELDLLATPRQPGSTLKPFVYELFFEHGGTGATVLDDIASGTMTGARGDRFDARDFDGRERGPVRARVALASSLNLAALDAARRVGADAIVARLRALGLDENTHDDGTRYGAAVVLGGMDVTPLALARAYVVLARGGSRVPLVDLPATAAAHGTAVMDATAAHLAWDVLSDAGARADGFGRDLGDLAGDGGGFALKTGTSAGFHDAWAAVSDARFTVVVWLGDPRGGALAGVAGFESAAPAAVRLLALARARADVNGVRPVVRPDVHLVEARVCAFTGLRAGPHCTHVVPENFPVERVPRDVCTAHDGHGDGVLGSRYAAWVARTHPAGVTVRATDVHDGELHVTTPRDGARWLVASRDATATVTLRASLGASPVSDAHWEVDGRLIDGDTWRARSGEHVVTARVGDRRSAAVRVRVATE